MIICNNCNQEIENSKDIYKVIDLGTIKQKRWQSIGLTCPHCQTFYHGYYTNDVLERRKARLKKLSGQDKQKELIKIQQYQLQIEEQGKRLFSGS